MTFYKDHIALTLQMGMPSCRYIILFCLCTFDWQTSERISHVAAVKINNVILKLDLFIMGLIHFSLKKGRANPLIQLYEQNITLFWSRRQRVELYIRLWACKAEVQNRLGSLHGRMSRIHLLSPADSISISPALP